MQHLLVRVVALMLEGTAIFFRSVAVHRWNAIDLGLPWNGLYGCAFVFESTLEWTPHIIR